jgi:hypothetical protein
MTRDSMERKESLWRRLGWMALIWAASVSLIGVVSLVLRWWIK